MTRLAPCLLLLLPLLVGGSCGGGSGSGGSPPVLDRDSDERRRDRDDDGGGGGVAVFCTPLPGRFPPGLDFVPGEPDRLLVANGQPGALLRYDADAAPAALLTPSPVPPIPADSDGDGVDDDSVAFPLLPLVPVIDGVLAISDELALLTASGLDEVIFVDPEDGTLVEGEVGVPAPVDAALYPYAPVAPEGRTAASTKVCLLPPAGRTDSFGDPIPSGPPVPPGCSGSARYFSSFTSGAAVAGGHLFVSTSNLGSGAGTLNTQFLPGSVLVFDFDPAGPTATVDPGVPVIFTEFFNPTHVTAFATPANPGRPFVLVTSSGALQLIQDDPGTPEIESGGLADSDAAIEVIDATALQLVATIPLGRVGLSFDRLAIDPSGRVAVTGSAVSRSVYAVDLEALDAIPAAAMAVPPVVLDGSDARVGNTDARIFFEGEALELPARPDGAPAVTCAGFTPGTGFDADGERLLVSDFCDGTVTAVDVDLSGSPSVPLPRDRFDVGSQLAVVAPVGAAGLGQARAPGALRVRPDGAGGPDTFVLVGEPEGELCSFRSADL